jgi:hypothetical protein
MSTRQRGIVDFRFCSLVLEQVKASLPVSAGDHKQIWEGVWIPIVKEVALSKANDVFSAARGRWRFSISHQQIGAFTVLRLLARQMRPLISTIRSDAENT